MTSRTMDQTTTGPLTARTMIEPAIAETTIDPLIGQPANDTPLECFEGDRASLASWRGNRTAVFCFSTWALGRGQLPLWQALAEQLPADTQVVGVAAEVEGERWLRGYLRSARVKFPVLIDRRNIVGGVYGFKAGPNVLLFGKSGTLAHRRLYDASLRKADCRADIEGFLLRGQEPAVRAVDPSFSPKPGSQEAFAEAVDLFLAGDLRGCRLPWRRSVELDREHWISQEQLWVLDAPERFHPYIDVAWQNEQLAAEGRPVCACEIEA